MNYNPNKAYKIRIVHPLDKVPNFNLILPRPNNNKILPSFMQKMFNRNAVYTMNDKNLILNEYSEQKLGKTMTSFFPKQSYNNIINMNIFTGNIFENDYNLEDVENKKEEMKFRLKIKNPKQVPHTILPRITTSLISNTIAITVIVVVIASEIHVARPSTPSVKFTAFVVARITNIVNGIYIKGGRVIVVLKKGMIISVPIPKILSI